MWGGGSNRVVVADVVLSQAVPAAPSRSSARSRSPTRAVAAGPLPLTDAQRGLKRCTADEVKERKRAQYRRVPGGSEKAAWPLPGHAVGEPTGRDEVPYRGVVSGQWRRGLWLDHVASALDTPLWIAHRQTWSLREEMFLQWAERERIDIVARGAQPPGSSLTAKELRVKSGRSDVVNVALNQFM